MNYLWTKEELEAMGSIYSKDFFQCFIYILKEIREEHSFCHYNCIDLVEKMPKHELIDLLFMFPGMEYRNEVFINLPQIILNGVEEECFMIMIDIISLYCEFPQQFYYPVAPGEIVKDIFYELGYNIEEVCA